MILYRFRSRWGNTFSNTKNPKKSQWLIVGAIFWSVIFASAQPHSVIPPNVRAVNTIERLTDSNGLGTNEMMYGIPLPPGKVIGETYLDTSWRRSVVLLYENNALLEGYFIRYDIKADELDIKTSDKIKVLEGKKVKSFSWLDSMAGDPKYFVNAKDFKTNGVPLSGFFEVLVDGQMPLFKKTSISIKKADYNVQLSIGNRDDKILKKRSFYLANETQVVELPGSKKRFLSLFKDRARRIEEYIDSNSLSIKREEDLIEIFKQLNSSLKI